WQLGLDRRMGWVWGCFVWQLWRQKGGQTPPLPRPPYTPNLRRRSPRSPHSKSTRPAKKHHVRPLQNKKKRIVGVTAAAGRTEKWRSLGVRARVSAGRAEILQNIFGVAWPWPDREAKGLGRLKFHRFCIIFA